MPCQPSLASLVFVLVAALGTLPGCGKKATVRERTWSEGSLRFRQLAEPVFKSHAVIRESGPVDGQVVLLVHGVGEAASEDWNNVVAGLSKTYRVVVVDLPGYGRSGKGNKLYSPDNYARFLSFLVGKIADGPVLLVGHSMGAAICLKFAAMFPAQVRKLVLADVAGILHREAFANHMVHQKVSGWKLGPFEVGGKVGRSLEPFVRLGAKLPMGPHELLNSKSGRAATLGGDPMKISAFALMLDNFGAALDKLQTRTLLIWGALDPVAPLRTGRMIAARVPSARLYTIAAGHHVPMKQYPKAFNRLLLAYFDEDDEWPTVSAEAAKPGAVAWLPTARAPVDNAAPAVVTCRGEKGRVFTGVFKELKLEDCNEAVIKNAVVGKLEVNNSRVRLRNVRVGAPGQATAISATHSRLHFTVGRVIGKTGMLLESTRLDAGAVRFVGAQAIAAHGAGSEIIASVCTFAAGGQGETGSQGVRAQLHGYWRLGVGATLPDPKHPNN